mmetsp:Transcript_30994/g.67088  ORF Transcript_30994/g.67088 Transcript_30994/m.67088 type:complete len:386 (+) Transcript_30994:93-1250(+)
MPPRAADSYEDIAAAADLPVVTNAPAPLDAVAGDEGDNAPVVDGEQFFTSTSEDSAEEGTPETDNSSNAKKRKGGFTLSFSSLEKSICKFGQQLEDEFIAAIDKTPLGVNIGQQPSSRTAKDTPTLERKASSFAKAAKAAKKTGVAVGGGALIGVGVVMIPTLPPPFASLTMLGGFTLLGTEFEGPRNVVKNARDKMRNIEDNEEEDEEDTTTEIEEEFTEGEPEDLLAQSASQTDAEYWGFGKDADKKTNENSNKSGINMEKTAKKLSKKYVLPALEKVCSAYEQFEDEDNEDNTSDTTFEEIKADEITEIIEENVESLALDTEKASEEQEEQASTQTTGATADDEFVDAKEQWVDVDEVDKEEGKDEPLAADADDSDEDGVLV